MSVPVTAALRRELSKALTERDRWQRRVMAIQTALSALTGRPGPATGKRRPMDGAERRAVSKRMKAYWAKRRAQRAKPSSYSGK